MLPSPFRSFALMALVLCASSPGVARDGGVPYWASIRVEKVNMRVGPGEDYRIAWVYRRPHLPVKVLRMKEGWRLVEDPGGAKGWVLGQFLSRRRGAIVRGAELADMRERPEPGAPLKWRLRPGVVGLLGECEIDWCELDVDGRRGFVRRERMWGAGEP